jgi:VWFA-related protein
VTGVRSGVAALVGALGVVIAAAPHPATLERIEVAVRTPYGSTIAELTKEDFALFVDGKPTEIQRFTAPPAPITIAFVFDQSASMSTYVDVDERIERAIVSSLTAEDRALIGGVANRLVLPAAFLPPGRQLIAEGRQALRVRKEDRFGPSPIWDAVDEAIRRLAPASGRRGLVLVSDGRATGNTVASTDAVARAVESGVVVQVLTEGQTMFLRQDKDSLARVRPTLMLEELAARTGGLSLPADPKPSAPLPPADAALGRLIHDLRQMYTLEIAPQGPPGSFHRVDVQVKRPGTAVRPRACYRTR